MTFTLLALLPLLPCLPPQIIGEAPPVIGPFIGNVTPTGVSVWVRLSRRDPIHMALVDASGKILRAQDVSPTVEQNGCVRWDLPQLEPDTSYAVTVSGDRTFFKTAPSPDQPTRIPPASGSGA